jgi:hypothetical protein
MGVSRRAAGPLAALLIVCGVCGAGALVVHSQQQEDLDPLSKLATVLADVAGAVPEDAAGDAVMSPAPQAVRAFWPASVEDALAGRRLRLDDRNRVQVYVLLRDVTPDRLRRLEAEGATIEIVSVEERRVQAQVPVGRLRRVAALPFVDFIRLPSYARRHVGRVRTEGDAIHRADLVRSQLGVDGTGVTVGVISDGIKGIFADDCVSCAPVTSSPIASGDLPGAVGVRDDRGRLVATSGSMVSESFHSDGDLEAAPPPRTTCAFEGAGAEGGALLEIVHDLAPGAALRFSNADTSLGFNRAVNALAAVSDVVVDDLGFFGEPANGESSVSRNTAAALNTPGNRIRTYVTSVGNGANNHYFGTFVDSGVDARQGRFIPKSGNLHLFQPSATTTDALNSGPQPFNLISLDRRGEAVVLLMWNDPAGRSGNNYDLFLVRHSTGQVVARSRDVQRGNQDPIEFVDYVNRGDPDLFRIVIQNVENRAAPRDLNLFAFGPACAASGPRRLAPGRHEEINFNTASRSLSAQSDAGGSPVAVISVGAICSASALAASVFIGSDAPSESCNDQTHRTAQFYSSRGPTLDGRMKPDIAAIDGVSVTGAGQFPSLFFGTSAAAPHVAGIAALALGAAPCLRAGSPGALAATEARLALRQLILSGADPIDGRPPDNTFGAGLANAQTTVSLAMSVCR